MRIRFVSVVGMVALFLAGCWPVAIQGDSLTLDMLDPDWLLQEIKNGGVAIPHVLKDDVVILTAPTGELQEFILPVRG